MVSYDYLLGSLKSQLNTPPFRVEIKGQTIGTFDKRKDAAYAIWHARQESEDPIGWVTVTDGPEELHRLMIYVG